MKTLENWFKTRRKIQSILMIRDHSKAIVIGAEQLEHCILFSINGRREDLIKSFQILQRKESEAAALKQKIILELAKGDLPSVDREDFMRLARAIDSVIDWVNETGRILMEFHLELMPEEIRSITKDIIKVVKNCVFKLDDCIDKLTNRKPQEALETASEVEILEEETDGVYRRARGAIGQLNGGNVPIGPAILVSQFLDALENIGDRCEDTVDEIRVIIVTMIQ